MTKMEAHVRGVFVSLGLWRERRTFKYSTNCLYRHFVLLGSLLQRRRMATKNLTRMLSNGCQMPRVGLGMWQMEKPEEVSGAMQAAVKLGYRHFDTSILYENEDHMGSELQKIIQSGQVKREDLFIATKLPANGMLKESVEYFLRKSLTSLKLDYLDLYLIHWPIASKRTDKDSEIYPTENGEVIVDPNYDLMETWQAMEELVDKGLVKSIGLSNCSSKQVRRIYNGSRIKPVNLQVECHVYLPQRPLVKLCKELGISVTAYSPLGTPGFKDFLKTKYGVEINPDILLKDEKILEIAKQHGKGPAQILLRYLIERDINVIPKSSNPKNMEDNMNIFDFKLTEQNWITLNSMANNTRYFAFSNYKNWTSHPEFPFIEEDMALNDS